MTDAIEDADEPLDRALAAAAPDRTVAGVERPTGSAHPGNEVRAVRFADGGRAYCKVATDGPAGRRRIAREAALTCFLGRQAPVRTPRVLAADPGGDPPYLLTAPLAGRRLADRLGEGTNRGGENPGGGTDDDPGGGPDREGGDGDDRDGDGTDLDGDAVDEDDRAGDGRDTDAVDPDALAAALQVVGAATADLHAVRFDRAGTVRGGDAAGLDVAAAPWPTVLRTEVADLPHVPDRFDDFPGRAADCVARHRDRLSAVGAGPTGRPRRGQGATVVHDDLHVQNVFDGAFGTAEAGDGAGAETADARSPTTANVVAGRPTDGAGGVARRPGVLDLESAVVGDPAFDLVRTDDLGIEGRPALSAPDRERVRAAFHDGYRRRALALGLDARDTHARDGLPAGYRDRRPVYRVLAFLRTAMTFRNWAPAAPEPVDDLAEWVHGEFDRRLDAAAPDGDGTGDRRG